MIILLYFIILTLLNWSVLNTTVLVAINLLLIMIQYKGKHVTIKYEMSFTIVRVYSLRVAIIT